ncbi:MAG: DUF6431 domain-containing protein [Faecalibacterium sp.]|nr:DUF6431 domain-containing protein [Ruminococcus sp.]MCM1391768.1 DUF6431 domain-containing protein [Ruminococcus sp.]MCM1485048.1 DUF6431 domain-containing protein [Faecalibacterium sp.]
MNLGVNMVSAGELKCPICGGKLKYYGKVKRILRSQYGKVERIHIRRMVCAVCGTEHRELPKNLLPYKHYDSNIIKGFVNGSITSFDLEYEDYPCETTIKEWKKQMR